MIAIAIAGKVHSMRLMWAWAGFMQEIGPGLHAALSPNVFRKAEAINVFISHWVRFRI